ncbi:MAG: SRPBCC domain-containing protein [Gemmatimonadetes bacterium]|nr:SRPBCC domain-containing protein [Gemmatimonadota bacterium]
MNIEHELVIEAPIARVFEYFSTPEGLDAWWTHTADAEPRLGGRYRFGFDADHQWAGVTRTFEAPHAIEWEMTETAPMPDWRGTRVGARLHPDGDRTRLHFYHRGWEGATQHCRISSFCWATYLRLLARHAARGWFVPYEQRNDLLL